MKMVENRKQTNVAFMLGSLNRGGAETLMLDCFQNYHDAAFSMIGIYRKDGVLQQAFFDSGVQLFRAQPKSRFDFFYFLKLRKLLKKNNIDIVHAQQSIDAFYAYIATFGLNIKIVLTHHGYDFNSGKIGNLINKFIINRTNLNVFVSEHQKKHYQKKYKLNHTERQRVIYNGISFKKLETTAYHSLIEELHLPQTQFMFGSVGNFVAVRDQLTICRFLNLLNKKKYSFHFFFVGAKDNSEPWRYKECEEYCIVNHLADNVHFLGSRNDVPALLKQLDAFVYSTNHDTFGIAVVEAIASALPVFVNDWEVMLEVTENGKYAEIYKTKNEEDLLIKFIHFINNKDRYKQQAAVNAISIKNKYSINEFQKQLLEGYQVLLK